MASTWLAALLCFCLTYIECNHAEITIVRPDGSQQTSDTASSTNSKKSIKKSSKTAHSQYNIMWVTPFEIFNVSTADDHVIDPAINAIMATYGEYLYNRFITGIKDGTITLHGLDEKASLNDKFFALQQHLHETDKLHKSAAVPRDELAVLRAEIKKLVQIYLKRCGVQPEVIADALSTIHSRDKANGDENVDASQRMFLWATLLSNGSYHAPHSHEQSIVSGVYFAKIPQKKLNEESSEDVGGYLVFGDPRGAGIYPFGLKYIHVPIEGQIVLFPGYLTHWVEPVKSSESRISFSFNVPGSWDELSDTSMFYSY